MFNYPYGDSQQINLNWIINEIIQLHKQLDPDYETPTFTQIYPFSDTQQLNLDWILTELKALKELAPTPPPTELIDEIGQALIADAYDADTSYQKNDYIVQDGKLYRANAATTGTFDPTKWNEVMLGNDLAIITRWADATNTFLNALAASNVANDSSVTGTTVKDALDTLKNADDNLNSTIGNVQWQISAYVETGNTATKSGGYAIADFVVWKGRLYRVISQIPQNAAFTPNTNIKLTAINEQLTVVTKFQQQTISGNYIKAVRYGGIVNFTVATGSFTTNEDHYIVYNDNVIVLDAVYRPPFNVEMYDVLGGNRVIVQTDGHLYSAFTGNANLRMTSCWIASDAAQ